jgi:hypothetical protein
MVVIPESLVNTFEGSIILNVLGGILSSIAFAVILHLWQKPWLQFYREPLEIKDTDEKDFYHIVVKNNGHRTAYNCKVDIVFNSKDWSTPISISYGKWALNPEPVVPIVIKKPMEIT